MTDNALMRVLTDRRNLEQPTRNWLIPFNLAEPVIGFANELATGFGGVRDVLRGGYVPGRQAPEDAAAVEDISAGMGALAGGSYTGASIAGAPRNALFTFAGPRAKTADRAALQRAQQMAADGVPREQIWQDTGWFKGVDDQWRWEVDDSGAIFTPAGTLLSETLGHKELFGAYPDLRDAEITMRRGSGGSYYPGEWQKFEDRYVPDQIEIGLEQKNVSPLSALLHEAAGHGVQHREGFAQGGSSRSFSPDDIAVERARIMSTEDDGGWANVGTASGDMADADVALALYRRLAGEVEARAVQARISLTPEQRRARPPWLDYDVPESDQIVRRR